MRVLILSAACAILFASCEKSYNCTCKNDNGGYVGQQIGVTGKSESDALADCQSQFTIYGNVSCELSEKD